MVVTFPAGTCFIKESTSRGAGITKVPGPHLALSLGVTFSTRGKPLLSASFSRHDLRVRMLFGRLPGREGFHATAPQTRPVFRCNYCLCACKMALGRTPELVPNRTTLIWPQDLGRASPALAKIHHLLALGSVAQLHEFSLRRAAAANWRQHRKP